METTSCMAWLPWDVLHAAHPRPLCLRRQPLTSPSAPLRWWHDGIAGQDASLRTGRVTPLSKVSAVEQRGLGVCNGRKRPPPGSGKGGTGRDQAPCDDAQGVRRPREPIVLRNAMTPCPIGPDCGPSRPVSHGAAVPQCDEDRRWLGGWMLETRDEIVLEPTRRVPVKAPAASCGQDPASGVLSSHWGCQRPIHASPVRGEDSPANRPGEIPCPGGL